MYIPPAFNQPDLPSCTTSSSSTASACSCRRSRAALRHPPAVPARTTPGRTAPWSATWHEPTRSGGTPADRPALAIFSGPHAYISPTWYEAEQVVPTWNYAAVHAYGHPDRRGRGRPAEDRARPRCASTSGPCPGPGRSTARHVPRRLLRSIVGFRIEIEKLEGKWKLNQNQPPGRRAKVVRALREQGGEDADAIADLMEKADR